MDRLTWRNDSGAACYRQARYDEQWDGMREVVVVGDPVGEKLSAFEDSGLTPEEVKRESAYRSHKQIVCDLRGYHCPRCKAWFISVFKKHDGELSNATPYCGNCGQKLDWSGS